MPEQVNDIAALAVAANTNTLVHDAIVIPKDYKAEGLERFQLKPRLFRAKFETFVLSEFVDYTRLNLSEKSNSSIFIDSKNMVAQAIMDMGTIESPEWGNHVANLRLIESPAYQKIKSADGCGFSQQEFLDFLDDCQENLILVREDQPANAADFLKNKNALRKLKVEQLSVTEQKTEQYASSRSALESIEIKANDIELPTAFIFTCEPFEGFTPIPLYCQLRISSDSKGSLIFKYRIQRLSLIKEAIAEEMRLKIKQGLKSEPINIFIGTMDYQ